VEGKKVMGSFMNNSQFFLQSLFSSNKYIVFVMIVAISVLHCFCHHSTLAQQSQGIVGEEQQNAVQSSLVGEWICAVGQKKIVLRLGSEGSFVLGDKKGQFVFEGNMIRLKTNSTEVQYKYELTDNELTLSGGDLSQPLKFTRMRGVGEYEKWLFDLSLKSIKSKLKRIAMILVITLGCRILLFVLRFMIHLTIYCDWGPLRFVYRHHKNRTMTIYSLLINLSKYIVYITATGFILSELGINYTAYLASLSVIGLAIGFGSQGLVQDMVTGFFIVFEEQFNVGDMVEIPPHVGIVQELGLRMTRLRNYLGQKVVIPNRNIATVGNYTKGAQHVNIDVAAQSQEAAEKAQSSLIQIVEDIGTQFEDVILSTPETSEVISLSTGEHFIRLHLTIWPQQQWVIEQEMIPRIRAALTSKGFEIPNDKITVFYYPREQQPIGLSKHTRDGNYENQLKK
jgi:small-conductance mechanosensitive channel